MHIPDGFLDTKTWVVLSGVSLGFVAIAINRCNKKIEDKQIPLMGVASAFVFVAQMINLPVAGGTSGHFLGALLAAVLLGPYSALLVMATVLIVQCLLFQDGGLTALGANVFNMGVIGSVLSYHIFLLLRGVLGGNERMPAAAAVAAWLSILFSASCCAVEIAFSGTVSLFAALPAMALIHSLIGMGEAAVTAGVLTFLRKARPDLLELPKV